MKRLTMVPYPTLAFVARIVASFSSGNWVFQNLCSSLLENVESKLTV